MSSSSWIGDAVSGTCTMKELKWAGLARQADPPPACG